MIQQSDIALFLFQIKIRNNQNTSVINVHDLFDSSDLYVTVD